MMKKITDFLLPKLFMLLVLLAPLSKLPSLALPTAHFTSFRIGLYQLLALGFVAVTLFAISKHSISRNFTLGIGVLLVAIALLGLFDGIELGRSALLTVSFLFLLSVMLEQQRIA